HEFSRLCNWLHQPNNLPTTIKIGTPLLSHHHATTTLFQAIISAATPTLAPDEALIMIAHHSRHPQAADTYHQAAAIARATSPHLFLGTHPNPANATAIAQTCHKLNYRHARLYPFTLTIGTTAQQILHPTAPNSWSTTLTQHHITATPHPIPLASHPTIIEYWLQQATQLLT
ncbi:MAG: hypothetical protein GX230_06715, partial [Lentisphaerae bacterium]|nr:hypothetical protein [Lentisphaerota bacterium]